MSTIHRRSRRFSSNIESRDPVPQWFFAAFTGDRSGSMSSMEGASATGLYEWVQTMKESANENNQTGFISVTTFDNVKNKCKYITPVPGGVGPMTVAMLMKNVYNLAENSIKFNL